MSPIPSLAVLAIAALALTGCGDAVRSIPEPTGQISLTESTTPPAADVGTAADAASSTAHPIATIASAVTVHTGPAIDTPAVSVSATTPYGTSRTLRVVEATTDGQWLRVVVPARPNNTTGWVAAADVDLRAVTHRIAVDLSDRTLVLTDGAEEVIRTTVAVGTAENPTPTGQFFVTDKIATNPDGAYGPFAFGVAAWSDTLSEFGDGDGQIAIHGTDQPAVLGTAASHGCIRVPNDVADRLAALLPLGVPVDIQA